MDTKPVLVEIRSVFSRERGLRYEVLRWHPNMGAAYLVANCKSYASARARARREVNRLNKDNLWGDEHA